MFPAIPWRKQLWLIGTGYVLVLLYSASLAVPRYLYEVRHPEEVTASSGMWAFGDINLGIFIGFLMLIPTFFLIRLIARFEAASARYSRLLLGLALTAPLCLGLLYLAYHFSEKNLADLCFLRFMVSPFLVVGLASSRILARFPFSKRLSSYALLIETGTFGAVIGLMIFSR